MKHEGPKGDVAWRGARITALATLIVGVLALVGIGINAYITLSEGKRREDTQARGAARVLISELFVAGHDIRDIVRERLLRRFADEHPVDVPPGDLRLIASRLSGRQWNRVSIALSDIANFRRLVERRLEREGPGPMPWEFVRYASEDLAANCLAQRALLDLAEFENGPCPILMHRPEDLPELR
jgi:AcrR family transcriptional regulator